MPASILTVAGTSLGQAIAAIAVAALLTSFQRRYGRSYLRHWAFSWWALALYHLGSAASLLLIGDLAAAHPLRLSLSTATALAGYLQLGWLLFGCYELAFRRPVRLQTMRRSLILLAAFALLATIMFVGTPGEEGAAVRYMTRVGLHALFAGIAFVVAARWLWLARRERREAFGFVLVSAAFFAYAIEHFHYFGLGVAALLTGTFFAYALYLGFIDFLLQALMALGMVTSLLEDEREAAMLATGQIEHLAYYDPLTGLPNRTLFFDRLIMAIAHAARTGEQFAVLFLDLDRFKEINDSLGHSTGDALLRDVARRIEGCVRAEDTIARFGGDEFTLLIHHTRQPEDAAKVAQKLIGAIRIPFVVHERELYVTTSVGVASFPSDGADAETLIRNADAAMYRAKEFGRDTCQLYTPAMNARALERLALENMMRRALAQQELVLFYQPLVDIEKMTITGMEALLRWKHPELGLLLPGHFIQTAEASGLIIDIGDWVMRSACAQARAWQEKFGTPLVISVNLSARQFRQHDLVARISRALDESGLDPGALEVEITESSAMQNAEATIQMLRELKVLGVRISMDDFGTGYSSLNYLKRFPIDTLKLDQSFVRDITTDPNDGAIASAVIAMAHSLRIHVVAEGVETEGQLEFLRARGCDRMQGYLFSRPVPPDAFESLIGRPPAGNA